MSEKRRGLGRGLGALIPTGLDGRADSKPAAERPVDVFFPDARARDEAAAQRALGTVATVTEERPASTPDDRPEASASEPSAPPVEDLPTPAESVETATAGGPSDTASGELEPTEGLLPVPGATFAELPVQAIRPNPRQPRSVFDEDALAELVGSIREIGVLQPVVVRPVADGYELIMGERRWRATQEAGLETIPAIIRETEDSDLLRDALLENLHRSQLNPLEEAAAYQQLLDDFGCTHEELATRIHRSRPQISNTLRLLKLPPLVQRRVAAGVISAGHARALLGLSDGAAMERLAQRIVSEGLSVRTVEEIVALGGDEEAPVRRAQPRAGVRNEALDDLAARLSDRFETRVKVALGKSRGRLTVEFASVQDLNRILEVLAPEDPGLLRR